MGGSEKYFLLFRDVKKVSEVRGRVRVTLGGRHSAYLVLDVL